ncbi:glycerol-3-phosphate 1-O-acyltransferase PlsY [Amphibacillus xylanus]|uniref:Glycerol-3-phosphate acyltransferase n=1 Tax=Amphibacillus xylanus (strain ATCC 51415 / DSM 6626 / JCM 7361 / LMG 17667 / NBRC 15112 / Ep01) TaxID=698758 RepID=K0IYA2_AMPXN|nr:glycerol-3-phosphate 1-O-acyltransferase PlsY [Amphibacillus xylanus]BAM47485.1 acyl-phosphate--glycerol-3-phosphate acyltransferase [Amphibacillus xylanus NBRC 15112]
MWPYVLLIILSYLIGSIPSALIVGKLFYQTDIREHGSGNLGGTNTFRVLGKKAGFIVTLADILKGTLAVTLPIILGFPEINPLIVGVFAVIGHMYPIFANFRGGKAVATSGGLILGINPLVFLIVLLSFFVMLMISKYVSLSSMSAGVIGVLTTIILKEYELLIVASILTVFIFYRHRANIKRIINKTEPKVPWP